MPDHKKTVFVESLHRFWTATVYGRGSVLFALTLWTALVGLSVGINMGNHHAAAFEHARLVADAYIDKDLAVRRWMTGHGGVYVKPSERTPPNPWLTVPNRDVTTTTGIKLTLVNPAYATRQLLEEFASLHGIYGRLTALKLKNPNNAPDAWERSALERLERGEKEIIELQSIKGSSTLRLMRPVFMEKGCFLCHEDMGIPLGGLRGGITASVPLEPFVTGEETALTKTEATHGAIWLVGLFGIGFYGRRRQQHEREQLNTLHVAQREDRRIAEVLSMSERLGHLTEGEVIQEGLEVAVRLTSSKIGFFHYVNEDQNSIELAAWSKATLESYCQAAYDTHYPIEQAGVWADCARLRQPVMHNDYPNLAIKRGLPDGHAALQRLMSVPVIEGGQVRVITGVGNKAADYDEHDVRLLQLLANDVWKLIQRKRADLVLHDSERRLREAQQVARLGTWETDAATGKIHWSAETHRIFGQDPVKFQPDRAALLALVHPEDQARARAALDEALAKGDDYQVNYRVTLPGGKIRHISERAHAVRSDAGDVERVIGTVQDVTEQSEVEKLRRNEADLSALFEHTDRLIWSIDGQCRLVIGNSRFMDAMQQLIGRPLTTGEVMPPPEVSADITAQWHECHRRALAGEQFSIEMQLSGLAKGTRWIDFSFFPILDESGRGVSGITISGRDFTERREMEENQVHTLQQMASMMRELEAHHRETKNVNQMNDLLQSCRDEAEAYEVIALSMTELFPGQKGCLSRLTESGKDLERVSCWGESPASRLLFGLDDCWALRRGQPHEVRRPGELACAHFEQAPVSGYLCLPLVVRGEMLGLLNIEYLPDADKEKQDATRELARSVGETIKISLSNLRLRVALQEQATHDSLTGLFNRRYLDETLPRELHRMQRAGGRMAVAMIDIDHFKGFNDSMGHEAGDQVLREIGAILIGNLRKSDTGCRYGGEELAVIMPESSSANARARLEEVCELIRGMKIDHHGTLLPQVTVSVGIAEASEEHDDAISLLRAADDALYQAKEAGRDRIVITA